MNDQRFTIAVLDRSQIQGNSIAKNFRKIHGLPRYASLKTEFYMFDSPLSLLQAFTSGKFFSLLSVTLAEGEKDIFYLLNVLKKVDESNTFKVGFVGQRGSINSTTNNIVNMVLPIHANLSEYERVVNLALIHTMPCFPSNQINISLFKDASAPAMKILISFSFLTDQVTVRFMDDQFAINFRYSRDFLRFENFLFRNFTGPLTDSLTISSIKTALQTAGEHDGLSAFMTLYRSDGVPLKCFIVLSTLSNFSKQSSTRFGTLSVRCAETMGKIMGVLHAEYSTSAPIISQTKTISFKIEGHEQQS